MWGLGGRLKPLLGLGERSGAEAANEILVGSRAAAAAARAASVVITIDTCIGSKLVCSQSFDFVLQISTKNRYACIN